MSGDLLIRHSAPTLAGLKTGSIFSCPNGEGMSLNSEIAEYNRRFSCKGLRIIPLRRGKERTLIYVYRPKKLAAELASSKASEILCGKGYPCRNVNCCVAKLIEKMRTDSRDFPHEIGLFLGYPPEDVRGFIEGRRDCKWRRCLEVYGDEEAAKKQFAKYKKCTDVYGRCFADSRSMDRLVVNVN